MAIDRLRSPYNNLLAVKGDVGPSAYSSVQVGGSTSQFVSDGTQANTIVGVTYRCHIYEYQSGVSQTITFSRGGNIDLLMVAAGGSGGGGYDDSWNGGGGGSGGIILNYGYGITNQTYAITVADSPAYTDTNYYLKRPNGLDTTFNGLTAIGGGAGGTAYTVGAPPSDGGSGGAGGSGASTTGTTNGAGTAGQGYNSGKTISAIYAAHRGTGGGGGYTGPGTDDNGGYHTAGIAGNGGDGMILKFDDVSRGMGGGGGGSSGYGTNGTGGIGGATGGSVSATSSDATGWGNGGGGVGVVISATTQRPSKGSKGLLIIRYAVG